MKTILVPVDLSDVTARVCKMAAELARTVNARLVLLHAVQPPPMIMGDAYTVEAGQLSSLLQSAQKIATRKLDGLARSCRQQVENIRTVQRAGQPVEAILAEARTAKADFIVIGSHGHGAVYDLLVGSTTQGVLRRAPCPVLVVPPVAKRQPRARRLPARPVAVRRMQEAAGAVE